jgi:hypothetical protein
MRRMLRRFHRPLLIALLSLCACGNLEADRICLNGPCAGQSRACKDYVACYEKTGGTPGVLDSSYGPGGTCWTLNSQTAMSCTAACTSAISSLRSAYPDAGCP